MGLIESLISTIAPHVCLGCNSENGLLCADCIQGIKRLPPRCYRCRRWSEAHLACQRCRPRTPLYSVHAVATYDGAAKELVHALKFARAKTGAKVIARLLTDVCPTDEALIVGHIPTAPSRIRQRGFDQAALIAKRVAQQLGRPYLPLLARTGQQRQLGQSRDVRVSQMANVFLTTQTLHLQNKH